MIPAGYKINVHKLIAFLNTNNELPERDCKKTIPLTTASQRKNHLEII